MTLPTAPAARPRRAARLLTAVATAATGLAATALLAAAPAHAVNPPGAHDPIGGIDTIVTNADHSFTATGWAADPDNRGADAVVGIVIDGVRGATARTSVARPDIASTYRTGATPGFVLRTRNPGSGVHTVCFVAYNTSGAGLAHVLRCITSPRGSYVDVAAHSPQGAATWAGANRSTMTVSGHVNDPDFLSRRVTTVLYVDGSAAKTVNSAWAISPSGAAVNFFSITVPVSSGSHLGCVWAVNVGFGKNSLLGCRTADTRGASGTGALSTPAENTAALAEAKRQIGRPYVWGAAGPSTFDCSGLVVYSYAKAGITNLPHQSGMQFNLARPIPASRAVPGDLVFYHDTTGSVYHVGIYVSPGNTVAAIDYGQGVDYQSIWDPTTATYGSLTHT